MAKAANMLRDYQVLQGTASTKILLRLLLTTAWMTCLAVFGYLGTQDGHNPYVPGTWPALPYKSPFQLLL